MPPVVTLIDAVPVAAQNKVTPATLQAGKPTRPSSDNKPYKRPAPSSKLKAEKDAICTSTSPLSLLERPPPSFPVTASERSVYLRTQGTAKGKKVTAFQWRLYDMLCRVPPGKVSTYGQLASLLSSSPRAVGSALRNNPFAPTVPCHRIIAATHFIGGFGGEWTSEPKKGDFEAGEKVREKLELLRREGVDFDGKGFLEDKACLWDGKEVGDM
ncbi:hypothetical protein JCM11641_002884 [Rhodosporidiobolus odoratus]